MSSANGSRAVLDDPCDGYRHEAFFYGDMAQFLAGTTKFLGNAIERADPILVAVSSKKITALRATLGPGASSIEFVDMEDLGRNPARIIAAWHDFLNAETVNGRQVHGVGEPIWAGRAEAEIVECQQHEALLNVVFDDPAFRLLCPYNEAVLPDSVLDEALRTHPLVFSSDGSTQSSLYPGDDALAVLSSQPLPAVPEGARTLEFAGETDLPIVRAFIAEQAAHAAFGVSRIEDIVVAANEMATNTVRYGGRSGSVQTWTTEKSFIAEFRDSGFITEPLIGRLRPSANSRGGRGFWLANQLCELVQIRVFESGSVVRLHAHIA